MIFRIVKLFAKIGFGIGLGIIVLVFIIHCFVGGVKTYIEDSESPRNDASYIVRAHQICEDDQIGSSHICCIPGCETIFVKKSSTINACCPEHERQYQEIYKNWVLVAKNKEALEKQGIRFK